MHATYVIIGAGPTGLGAAHRLRELGQESFLVLEKNGHAGGLSASFRDAAGCTWDIGGHVIFSHYEYFDRLLDDLLQGEHLEHQRVAFIRTRGRWVPYPFQNNIRHLPAQDQWSCVQGLLPGARPEGRPAHFGQWIETVFGRGMAEIFLWPYNFKVWATPPQLMSYAWIGERVSVVSLEGVLKNIVLGRDEVSWGPNNTFRFPLHGGTGEIFRRLADRVADHVLYGAEVAAIDARAKVVRTTDGREVRYEKLLSTAPLDLLAARWLQNPPDAAADAAKRLKHNGVYVAGLAVQADPSGDDRCWMYFPDDEAPFYRATNFHNYSPNNAGPGRKAFMCETSFSGHKPEDIAGLMARTEQGLVNTGLMTQGQRQDIVSRWECSEEYGYPVPCLDRDETLQAVQPRLEALDIFSRGRFGGYKYEVGNMDHSVMQGVEWAERMVEGRPERTYSWK